MKIAFLVKAKHGHIYEYMTRNNLSAAELARQIGIHQTSMGKILNFKWRPGKIRTSFIEKLENFFHVPIDYLFPQELTESLSNELSKKRVKIKEIDLLSLEDVKTQAIEFTPEDDAERSILVDFMKDSLDKKLTVKEGEVIKRIFYGESETEIAKALNLSKSRVYNLRDKCYFKLRIDLLKKTGNLPSHEELSKFYDNLKPGATIIIKEKSHVIDNCIGSQKLQCKDHYTLKQLTSVDFGVLVDGNLIKNPYYKKTIF